MLEGRRIVIVEDDEIMGASLVQRLELEGAEVEWHRHAARALPAIRTPRRPIDAVVCDIRLPDGTGEEIYETLTRTAHPPPFLFVTGQGGIAQAVRLIRSGAADYITKPFDMGPFLERLTLVMRGAGTGDMPGATGISPAARALDRLAAGTAARDTPFLIRGAPGLGKLRLARRIHAASERRAAPFVVLDALREPVSPGAFDAAAEAAGEGTLAIVGVGRLPGALQDRLAGRFHALPFRLAAISGLRLPERAAAGRFRTDLLHALMARELVVPPLADRGEDAVWLAARLFPHLNARRPAPLDGIAASAEDALRAHDWPGNGRELRARLARAVDTAEGPVILTVDLFPERAAEPAVRALAQVRDTAERAEIRAALDHTGGQIGEAARLLRVSRTTLWEKMQKLGL